MGATGAVFESAGMGDALGVSLNFLPIFALKPISESPGLKPIEEAMRLSIGDRY